LHFNGKKNKDSIIDSHFLSTLNYSLQSILSSSSTPFSEISLHNNRLAPISILKIDKNSRLTLTKRVKKELSLNPNDQIIVYQDVYDKNVLYFQIKKEVQVKETSMVVEEEEEENNTTTWMLVKDKVKRRIKKYNITEADKDIEKKYKLYKHDQHHHHDDDQDTLCSMPILLIDDENYILSAIGSTLKSEGYRNIKTFSDPRKALIHVLEMKENLSHYRLAIIDVRMPDINGINLYRMLKMLEPSISIIFMTELDVSYELTTIYPELKPADILRKPFDERKLIETVNEKVSRGLKTRIYDRLSLFYLMAPGSLSILHDTILCRIIDCCC
jgi:CheY-like chemotaxis protein